jgi:hypothetical protein
VIRFPFYFNLPGRGEGVTSIDGIAVEKPHSELTAASKKRVKDKGLNTEAAMKQFDGSTNRTVYLIQANWDHITSGCSWHSNAGSAPDYGALTIVNENNCAVNAQAEYGCAMNDTADRVRSGSLRYEWAV